MLNTKEIVEVALIAVVQVGVLVWYFNRNKKKSDKNKEREALAKEYPYEGMRNLALNMVPGAIVANVPQNEVYVYSVLMDWNMGQDMVTLVTQVTGEANLYVKSGGGIIGAGKYPGVSTAAQAFTAAAGQYLTLAVKSGSVPLPQANCVQFCLLTNNGKYVAVELMQNIENKTSGWTSLFAEASSVIGKMREAAI